LDPNHHPNYQLWWPNGFGEQPLYNLSVSLAFDTASLATDTATATATATASGTGTDTGTLIDSAIARHAATQAATATRRIGFRYAVLVTGNDTNPDYVKAAATQDGEGPLRATIESDQNKYGLS
jgi:hypothetical protein